MDIFEDDRAMQLILKKAINTSHFARKDEKLLPTGQVEDFRKDKANQFRQNSKIFYVNHSMFAFSTLPQNTIEICALSIEKAENIDEDFIHDVRHGKRPLAANYVTTFKY